MARRVVLATAPFASAQKPRACHDDPPVLLAFSSLFAHPSVRVCGLSASAGQAHTRSKPAPRPAPGALLADRVPLQTPVQRPPADAEQLGCRHAVAVHLSQDIDNVLALD